MKSVIDPIVVLQCAFLLKFSTLHNKPFPSSFEGHAGVIDYLDFVKYWHLDIARNLLVWHCFRGAVILIAVSSADCSYVFHLCVA